MKRNNYGHIINHSPPLINIENMNLYKNKTAYLISKLGMSMVAMGVAAENKNSNIAANTIWPKTAIETDAVKKNNLGSKRNRCGGAGGNVGSAGGSAGGGAGGIGWLNW